MLSHAINVFNVSFAITASRPVQLTAEPKYFFSQPVLLEGPGKKENPIGHS